MLLKEDHSLSCLSALDGDEVDRGLTVMVHFLRVNCLFSFLVYYCL